MSVPVVPAAGVFSTGVQAAGAHDAREARKLDVSRRRSWLAIVHD